MAAILPDPLLCALPPCAFQFCAIHPRVPGCLTLPLGATPQRPGATRSRSQGAG